VTSEFLAEASASFLATNGESFMKINIALLNESASSRTVTTLPGHCH
jgi:hypothetical protein